MPHNTSEKTVIIFGANGRVGKLVVFEAINRGYNVIAFIHKSNTLPYDAKLKIFRGDIHSKADVKRALREADIVISCLGSWGTKSKDILSTGMRNIVPVMEELGIARIISLTGADAVADTDKQSWLNKLSRFFIGIIGNKVITDAEEHIRILQASSLDWTVVRSPIMLSGKLKSYKFIKTIAPFYKLIRRASVAWALVDIIENNEFSNSIITIIPDSNKS